MNLRAFLRNPQKYPDPESYRPERWLEQGWPTYQEPLTQYPTIMNMSSFGWGQRQCLGQSITRDETIVACGALLWGFNLVKKLDANGRPITPPLDKSNSLLIIKPDPFEMGFEPRSAERKQEILLNWKIADEKDTQERLDFVKNAQAAQAVQQVPIMA